MERRHPRNLSNEFRCLRCEHSGFGDGLFRNVCWNAEDLLKFLVTFVHFRDPLEDERSDASEDSSYSRLRHLTENAKLAAIILSDEPCGHPILERPRCPFTGKVGEGAPVENLLYG